MADVGGFNPNQIYQKVAKDKTDLSSAQISKFTADLNEYVNSMFAEVDTDKSGTISQDEFFFTKDSEAHKNYIASIGLSSDDAATQKKIFEALDINGDGVLDYKELVTELLYRDATSAKYEGTVDYSIAYDSNTFDGQYTNTLSTAYTEDNKKKLQAIYKLFFGEVESVKNNLTDEEKAALQTKLTNFLNTDEYKDTVSKDFGAKGIANMMLDKVATTILANDTDQDKTISKTEWLSGTVKEIAGKTKKSDGIKEVLGITDNTKLEKLFNLLDTDNNGKLSTEELAALFLYSDYVAGGENKFDGYLQDRGRGNQSSETIDLGGLLDGDTASEAILKDIQSKVKNASSTTITSGSSSSSAVDAIKGSSLSITEQANLNASVMNIFNYATFSKSTNSFFNRQGIANIVVEEVNEMLHIGDKDGDKKINFDDWKASGMTKFHGIKDEAKLQAIFNKLDRDGDKALNAKELAAFFIFCDYYAGNDNVIDGYAQDKGRNDSSSIQYDMRALEDLLTVKEGDAYDAAYTNEKELSDRNKSKKELFDLIHSALDTATSTSSSSSSTSTPGAPVAAEVIIGSSLSTSDEQGIINEITKLSSYSTFTSSVEGHFGVGMLANIAIEEINEILRAGDKDGDRRISLDDWKTDGMYKIHGIKDKAKLEKLFKLLDKDGDGQLSPKELAAFFIFTDYYAGGENLLDGYVQDRGRKDISDSFYDMSALEAVAAGDAEKKQMLNLIHTIFGM